MGNYIPNSFIAQSAYLPPLAIPSQYKKGYCKQKKHMWKINGYASS